TKIFVGDQDACALVSRLVESEFWIERAIGAATPVEEDEFAKAGFLNALQELLGNDLVGINVGAVERRHAAFMYSEWIHGSPLVLAFAGSKTRRSTCCGAN